MSINNDSHHHVDDSVLASATSTSRFLIGVTGSIAATRAPQYVDALRDTFGGTYTAVMTYTATQFIAPEVLRLHVDHVVVGEDPQQWPTDRPSRLAADHDVILVLPATAHVLSCVATGAAPNRLTTVIMSSRHRAMFFPHMGTYMWSSPAVSRNVAQLRADGHHVVEPVLHDSRDVVTGELIRHPALPEPSEVVDVVRSTYPVTTVSGGSTTSSTAQ